MRKREGMKKRRSRILAWLLACLMVLSVIQGTGWGSFTVQAEESNEEERGHTYENGFCKACDAYEPAVLNSNNAYEIGNAGQLYWFADKVNKERYKYVNAKAVLTADIVVNKNVLNDGDLTKDVDGLRDWTPIQQYGGTFDGAQHTISGIYCVSDTIDEAGIFQNTIDNAIVENIGVLDSYYCLKKGYNVGGIVGFNSGIIRNCYNEGMVSSLYNNDNYLGGICGMNGGGDHYRLL